MELTDLLMLHAEIKAFFFSVFFILYLYKKHYVSNSLVKENTFFKIFKLYLYFH